MSADDVKAEILEPMQRMFEARRGLTEEQRIANLREYLDMLAHFDAETLRVAWREVRSVHQRAGWPAPALILGACRKAIQTSRVLPVRGEDEDTFLKMCEVRGLDPGRWRRPLMWWLRPRAEWEPHWQESEIPEGER